MSGPRASVWSPRAAAAFAGLLLLGPGSAAGQVAAPSVPGRPAVPGAPTAPAAPARPGDPTGAVHQLSLALLGVDARGRTVDTLVLDVSGSLLELGGGRDLRPLSRALVDTLRGRALAPGARDRIATSIVLALDAPDLEPALGEVEAALAAAGLDGPGVVLVERELRRVGGRRR